MTILKLENKLTTGLKSSNGSPNIRTPPTRSYYQQTQPQYQPQFQTKPQFQTQTPRQQYSFDPTPKPFNSFQIRPESNNIGCGVPANSVTSLVVGGQAASRGKWPW